MLFIKLFLLLPLTSCAYHYGSTFSRCIEIMEPFWESPRPYIWATREECEDYRKGLKVAENKRIKDQIAEENKRRKNSDDDMNKKLKLFHKRIEEQSRQARKQVSCLRSSKDKKESDLYSDCGYPETTHEYASGTQKQLVYTDFSSGDRYYVYVESGKVASWQKLARGR